MVCVKRRFRVAAVLVALLFGGAGAGAQTGLTLHGKVVDEDGLPVGGVQVKLELVGAPTNSTGATFSTNTNEAGSFLVANLAAGEYVLRAEKPGFFVLAGG